MPELLADHTTLRLGGPAARVVTAPTTPELVDLIRGADDADEPVLILGGGSNLVLADAGWPGVVARVRTTGLDVREEAGDVLVTADAGVRWDDLVAESVQRGWSGLAAMSGIPGFVGATPVQNVGAYGSDTADVLDTLTALDRRTGEVETWSRNRCEFGFRTSAFKHTDRWVILDVTYRLATTSSEVPVRYLELARRLGVEPGDTAPAQAVRETVLELRAGKGMVLDEADHDTWSVGSFFVNPLVERHDVPPECPHWEQDGKVKLSAAWLIETAGYGKGFGLDRGDGTVSVSTKHSLALTNRGGATTAGLLDLARVIRDGVEAEHGVRLRPEAHLVGVEL